MASTERGPIKRRGAVTNSDTKIGTTDTSTGLPQQSNTTSFANNTAGTADGNDSPSAFVGFRSDFVSIFGTSSPGRAYFETSTVPGGNQGTPLEVTLPLVYNTAGSTLPVPTGGGMSLTKYYKMVGYYTTGAVYESFVVTGAPASPTTTNPNTGHTLVNTFVSSFWEV